MVKLINPFRGTDAVAQTLSQLGQNMFGDQTGAAKRKEDLYAAQRTNAETDNLMGLIGQQGSFGSFKSPIGQAMALGAGMSSADAGGFALLDSGLNFGAADPRTQNAQVASGQSFDNTADAFGAKLNEVMRSNDLASSDRRYGTDQTVAQSQREFANKPMPAIGPDGKPAFATQGAFDGFSPILSNTEAQGTFARQNFGSMGDLPTAEQNYLGADSATSRQSAPKNYVAPGGQRFITYDGVTNAQDNSPLPTGGYIAGVQGGAEDALGSNALTTQSANDDQGTVRTVQEYFDLSSQLRGLAQTSPESFGAVGNVRGTLQEVAQVAPALNSLLGGGNIEAEAGNLIDAFGSNPAARGLLGEMLNSYDGKLPTVRTLGVVLKYRIAAALLGQSGRDLTDKDIAMVGNAFPDPQDWLGSSQATLAALDVIDGLMEGKRARATTRLNSGSIAPPGASAAETPKVVNTDGWTDAGNGVKMRQVQ